MDALALLCNLHADGPMTLQRLRRASVEEIDDLEDLQDEGLADVLGTDVPGAERFRREGRLLLRRLADDAEAVEGGEESTPDVPGGVEAPSLLGEEPEALPSLPEVLEAARLDEPRAGEEAPPVPSDSVGSVLEVWRALDRSSPPPPPAEGVVPQADPRANEALDEAALDGLGLELATDLAELGVLSLRGLVEAEPLVLANDLGIPFTRLRRLQFLASRRLSVLERETPAAEPAAPESLGVSGPFA